MTTLAMLPVTIWTEKSVPTFSTDRLSVVRWKATEKQPKPHAPVCVSVPRIPIIVEPAILQAALRTATDDMQDALVRSIIESSQNKLSPIPAEKVTTEAVAAFAQATNESKRLSKEAIEKWFDQYVSDQTMLYLGNKYGINETSSQEQLQQINNTIASAKMMIASLASPRSNYPETTLTQLQKVISLCEEESGKEMQEQLQAKITALLQPKAVTLALNI